MNYKINPEKKRGRQPRFDFTALETWSTLNGEVARNGHQYRVTFPRLNGKKIVTYRYDFNDHPLRDLISVYLYEEAEEITGGTHSIRCHILQILGELLHSIGQRDLNPEIINFFIRWLLDTKKPTGKPRFADNSIYRSVSYVRAFYIFGLCRNYPGWSQSDLDIICDTINKELRGWRKRSEQNSVNKALSTETFTDLAKAVMLEFQQCRQILQEKAAGRRTSLYNLEAQNLKKLDPNPFVVFSLQCAMRNGVRSCELNTLCDDDIHIDQVKSHHKVYLHGPNKSDSFISVDDMFLETLNLCREWSQEARKMAGPIESELFKETMLIYPATNLYNAGSLVQVNSFTLNNYLLPYFYNKWFDYKIKDQTGNARPLLHADGDITRPLWCNFQKLRNAFAVRFAEREKNLAIASKALRHRDPRTTEKFYLQKTRLDHAKKVQIALKPEAQLLVMGLKNATAAGISEVTLKKARDNGSMNRKGV